MCSLLRADELTYLGAYKVPANPWGQAFTTRWINGQFRVYSFGFRGNTVPAPQAQYALSEYSLPAAFGATATRLRYWLDIWNATGFGRNGRWLGLGWDADGRLVTGSALDYLGTPSPYGLHRRTLNDNGTITDLEGPLALDGLSPRRYFGNFVRIPPSWQALLGVGPYAVGGGGYLSTMCVDSVSMGPTLYGIPAPDWPSGHVPSSAIRTLMDHGAGSCQAAWYPGASAPTTYDRGVRNTDVAEEYDTWISPAPDGLGRWTWADQVWNTVNWIDTSARHGVLLLASLANGRAWYQYSTLHSDRQTVEAQVFDPNDFVAVLNGSVPPSRVQPRSRQILSTPDLRVKPFDGNTPSCRMAGASFDPITNRVYGYVPNAADGLGRIYAWQIPAA